MDASGPHARVAQMIGLAPVQTAIDRRPRSARTPADLPISRALRGERLSAVSNHAGLRPERCLDRCKPLQLDVPQEVDSGSSTSQASGTLMVHPVLRLAQAVACAVDLAMPPSDRSPHRSGSTGIVCKVMRVRPPPHELPPVRAQRGADRHANVVRHQVAEQAMRFAPVA